MKKIFLFLICALVLTSCIPQKMAENQQVLVVFPENLVEYYIAQEIVKGATNMQLLNCDSPYDDSAILITRRKEIDAKKEIYSSALGNYWMSLNGTIDAAKNIANGLSAIDPKNTAFYLDNLNIFSEKLKQTYVVYSNKLSAKQKNVIITDESLRTYISDLGYNIVAKVSDVDREMLADRIAATGTNEIIATDDTWGGYAIPVHIVSFEFIGDDSDFITILEGKMLELEEKNDA